MGKAAAVWSLARPFTLLAPALGMVSGSMVALGTLRGRGESDAHLFHDAHAAILANVRRIMEFPQTLWIARYESCSPDVGLRANHIWVV